MPASTNNEIILIGGGEIRSENAQIASYLAERAGGEIGIVALAREPVGDFIERATKLFEKHSCKVRVVASPQDLEGLSLVYYAGGEHMLLAKRLKESGLHTAVLNAWRKKEVIVAGSSAGAMVLCGVMLEADDEQYASENGTTDLTYGLGPLGACFVAPHWSEWTKPKWRAEVIKRHGGGYYIWGIDENTAMTWKAGHCTVIGAGKVYAIGRMKGEWGNGEEFDVARGY